MCRKDYLEVFLALFRRYEWTPFFRKSSGEETVSKRIGAVSKEIQGSGVTWAADRHSRRTSVKDYDHVDITVRHMSQSAHVPGRCQNSPQDAQQAASEEATAYFFCARCPSERCKNAAGGLVPHPVNGFLHQ
jgi:hypothetical protein